ncbi:hypothetical protein [Ruegeria sp. HKCCD6119]|uniref:hypothetical protein n=1 Tax=Ruegeria sp. HKCCD6119 TaxID=2683003 RepID=UPI00149161CC|nr:hypothetical protein [Ruegeria sp. HKCCD6119]
MTALAWLGLAGLSDGVVEWKSWFEQGVMQHWRSVKEWITAVLLWWVPFRVPSWLIDYLVIAMIVVRTSPVPRWKENWRFGPEDAQEKYGYIPFTWKLEWAMSQVFIRWPRLALLFFSWPILFPLMTVEAIRGRAFAPEVNVDPKERRSKVIGWYRRISWSFISFIPVLFVCSTMLYEHG